MQISMVCDLSCTYLAHHELESVLIIFIIMVCDADFMHDAACSHSIEKPSSCR